MSKLMKIAKVKGGITLTADGERVMEFPLTPQGLAEAKRYKDNWNTIIKLRKPKKRGS